MSVRGLEIGKVSRLWLEPDGVHVVASSDQPLNLREDYSVSILASTVLGGRYLEIYEGSPDAGPVVPDTVLRGNRPIDIIEEATAVVEDIRSILVGGGVLDEPAGRPWPNFAP